MGLPINADALPFAHQCDTCYGIVPRMDVAALVRSARNHAGISQRELAARCGTSQSAIARYEAGRVRPSLATLERLVSACGQRLEVGLAVGSRDGGHLVDMLLAQTPDERLDSLARFAALRASVQPVA